MAVQADGNGRHCSSYLTHNLMQDIYGIPDYETPQVLHYTQAVPSDTVLSYTDCDVDDCRSTALTIVTTVCCGTNLVSGRRR